ncbi:MAG: HEAT repeat domain-containing protein [Planctomycetota bacterium]|jgi:Mg-chelatase subunit ChlD
MRWRCLLALLALVLPLAADENQAAFDEAREKVAEIHFETLDAVRRERLLEAIAGWDHPRAVPVVAMVAARYGLFVSVLERKLPVARKELEPYRGRRALTDEELRAQREAMAKLEWHEAKWRLARASYDRLIGAVGRYRDPRTIKKALADWLKHGSWQVRYLLARACPLWHASHFDAALSRRLFRCLDQLSQDAEPGVRIAVARAAQAFKRHEAVELLGKLLADEVWTVRAATVRSLFEAGSDGAITLLIDAMAREKGRLQDDINTALERLTGQEFDWPESWGRWWASVGRTLPKQPTGGPPPREKKARDTNRFYGIPTRSQRICYVIDISGSMTKEVEEIQKTRAVVTGKKERELPAEGRTRLEVAKNELKRAISNLNPQNSFNIIFFNHTVKPWRPAMVNATPEVKTEARKEIDPIRPGGTTYTLGALREAFTLAGAIGASYDIRRQGSRIDTIFLLSDGGPTDLPKGEEVKPMDPEVILESVRQWNRDAGIVIHTVAVHTEAAGSYFLKELAAQNGGKFVERK